MDSLIADLKTNIMTKQKEIGYDIGNVAWHSLNGYKELWNKADFDTKEYIVNEYGHPYSKKTLLWLKNLPLLKPIEIIENYKPYLPSNTGGKKRGQQVQIEGVNTARERSKTFEGIARTMAEQWLLACC